MLTLVSYERARIYLQVIKTVSLIGSKHPEETNIAMESIGYPLINPKTVLLCGRCNSNDYFNVFSLLHRGS